MGDTVKSEAVESSLSDMRIKGESLSDEDGMATKQRTPVKIDKSIASPCEPNHPNTKSESQSPAKVQSSVNTPMSDTQNHVEVVGGEVTLKIEPGKPPKLARSSSQKIVFGPAQLFNHLPDDTATATSEFEVIQDCIYGAKHMGSSEHDALDCDCTESLDGNGNQACGDDSDCINRATKMECIDSECNCGAACQNQRFQQKQYASVSVVSTEKKGYGLRTDVKLNANDFIFEYIGEVINETHFRRRMLQYDDEGIKHFYFMSLSKGEFVDATKKGNLGRFCNHSCNPNCYVDKWVVGNKLRMGIFAERAIKAGEELVFNYNVDRYGADPQPCYCGEPNCTGFIGGKTQTERATKLSTQTIEALGIDDGDGWDTAVSKKPRKKKVGEDDEEYVNNLQTRSLDESGVSKVMATLMQCKEKWIVVKLLGRIQQCESERVRNRVIKIHGYPTLNSTLLSFKDDHNVVLQVLNILNQMPRLTRNKIADSKIEETVESLVTSDDERVQTQASAILAIWRTLEIGYRIPRRKEQDAAGPNLPRNTFERRESKPQDRQSRPRSPTPEGPRGLAAPTGPRNSSSQRPNGFSGSRPPYTPRNNAPPLPRGWFAAIGPGGNTYYYSASGQTQWNRPSVPAAQPPPPPLKTESQQEKLQAIIDGITKAPTKPKPIIVAASQPSAVELPKERRSEKDKWKSLSEEKQRKLYENTIFPHVKYVVDKFKHKLSRDDLKRFAKEIGKKLVSSDYKHNRVENPTKISSRQEKQIKKFAKEFLDKAVVKRREHEKKKEDKKLAATNSGADVLAEKSAEKEDPEGDQLMDGSDIEDMDDGDGDDDQKSTPLTTPANYSGGEELKRKREDDGDEENSPIFDVEGTPSKRIRTETPPPPPPPPPPPCEDMVIDEAGQSIITNGTGDDGVGIDKSIPSTAQLSSTRGVAQEDEVESPAPSLDQLSSSLNTVKDNGDMDEYGKVNGKGMRHIEISNGA